MFECYYYNGRGTLMHQSLQDVKFEIIPVLFSAKDDPASQKMEWYWGLLDLQTLKPMGIKDRLLRLGKVTTLCKFLIHLIMHCKWSRGHIGSEVFPRHLLQLLWWWFVKYSGNFIEKLWGGYSCVCYYF